MVNEGVGWSASFLYYIKNIKKLKFMFTILNSSKARLCEPH